MGPLDGYEGKASGQLWNPIIKFTNDTIARKGQQLDNSGFRVYPHSVKEYHTSCNL